jgi:Protein of unknown function (DUF3325)
MMTALTLLCGLAAALAFGLAKPKHYRQVTGHAPRPRSQRAIRAAGWVLTILAAIAAQGATSEWLIAVALVAGAMASGGIIVTLILGYRPKLLRFLTPNPNPARKILR